VYNFERKYLQVPAFSLHGRITFYPRRNFSYGPGVKNKNTATPFKRARDLEFSLLPQPLHVVHVSLHQFVFLLLGQHSLIRLLVQKNKNIGLRNSFSAEQQQA
jgi:hypothetical protein